MSRRFMVLVCAALVVVACNQKTETKSAGPLAPAPGGVRSADAPTETLVPSTATTATTSDAGIPIYDTPEEFTAACTRAVADVHARLAALEAYDGPRTIANVLAPANEMWRVMSNGWNEASLMQNVHPDPAYRKAAEDCDQEFVKLQMDINLSRRLYDRIVSVNVAGADEPTQYSQFKLVRDFKRAGVDRDGETRSKIRVLVEGINLDSQRFGRAIREDARGIEVDASELSGLPEDYIAAHPPQANGKILITTDSPDYVPFMTYADSDAQRKALRTAQRNRGYPDNAATLKSLLSERFQLAQLLGYPNYASYITEDKMVGTPEAAQAFLDDLAKVVAARVSADKAILLSRLRDTDHNASEVQSWQYPYLAEQERKARFSIDSKELRTYFRFGNVRQGIFALAQRMFGITIKDWDAPVWAPDVTAHEIWEDGKLIGRFYLDLHPREGKYKHAAHFPIRLGIDGKQLPLSALVCNFPGAGNPDSLMEHSDVVTFLHEFGHLLHSELAGQGQWINNSGVATEWDFVEAPSQLLEEWAYDYPTLKTFAINAGGKSIPEDLVKELDRARRFGEGIDTATQLYYAALSLDYYDRDPAALDLDKEMSAIEQKYSPFPALTGTHFYASFGHLDGYSAMYYTYQWSLAIAHDLHSRFETDGVDNPLVSLAYRRSILDPGGSKPADQLIRDFMGRPFTLDAYHDWLTRAD